MFRRDAGALSAYLVDAETGELHPTLSDGQRRHDLELAVENLGGELTDLEEAGVLPPAIDPIETAFEVRRRYRLRVNPRVVEPGYHQKRLLSLTGLDVQENQARRLLDDLLGFREEIEHGDAGSFPRPRSVSYLSIRSAEMLGTA